MENETPMLNDFSSSLRFLIQSMRSACQYITKQDIMDTKPSWMTQTDKFFSLFERLHNKDEAMDNLKKKVIFPVYNKHYSVICSKIIDDENVVQDDFLKISTDNNDRLRTTPQGLFFGVSTVFLPISEVYSRTLASYKKDKRENPSYHVRILIGLYSTFYYVIRETESVEDVSILKDNIEILTSSIDLYDSPVKQKSNQTNMLQEMLGKIDMGQIGEMMGKVTGDEQASKEFGEVFGKMTDIIKSGGNPLEAMGDIIKQASSRANEDMPLLRENIEKEEKEEKDSLEKIDEENETIGEKVVQD